jgi:predicted nucleotidyltransferase
VVNLPRRVRRFVQAVVETLGSDAREVWLIGSRANRSERDESDWDFVVFTSQSGIEKLEANEELRSREFDLLARTGDGDWISPWKSEGKWILRDFLKWRRTSERTATYLGRPDAPSGDWLDGQRCPEQDAIRIWPFLNGE